MIYETEYRALLQETVALNSINTLKRYTEINTGSVLCPAEVYYWDSFYVASGKTSTAPKLFAYSLTITKPTSM